MKIKRIVHYILYNDLRTRNQKIWKEDLIADILGGKAID